MSERMRWGDKERITVTVQIKTILCLPLCICQDYGCSKTWSFQGNTCLVSTYTVQLSQTQLLHPALFLAVNNHDSKALRPWLLQLLPHSLAFFSTHCLTHSSQFGVNAAYHYQPMVLYCLVSAFPAYKLIDCFINWLIN